MLKKLLLASVALITTAQEQGLAQDLRIGLVAQQSAADPHFHNLSPNNQLAKHLFDGLTQQDENQNVSPALAVSFKPLDNKTWEFKLRQGVKFSNGDDFTAQDVIFSLCRVSKVENSPSSFAGNTKAVESVTVVDAQTLHLKTANAYPLLPSELSTIAIISSKAAGLTTPMVYNKAGCDNAVPWPKTEDFNNLKLAVGTGPFVLKEFTKGERTLLARNETYWGEKPFWKNVTMRPITQTATRVASLIAGDVDFIENPPVQDLPRLKLDGKVIAQGLSSRIIYLHFNYIDDKPLGIAEAGDKNPLRDVRVRQALSKAIDREAIVARIMGGVAQAAGELLGSPMQGTNADMKPEKLDVEGAKKLLAEAGYPNGFTLTLGAPNDRYINDSVIAPALAQMFARIGVKTNVDAMTATTFFAKRNKRDFAIWLAGWGSDSGEMSSPLRSLVATPNKEKGNGSTNPGGYSNPAMDAMLEKALSTLDTAERNKLLAQASLIAMKDYGVLPLHVEVTTWAMAKGLSYQPRTDQYTLAAGIKKQ
jgi:peptide/nickel transport system substrate-binding protein